MNSPASRLPQPPASGTALHAPHVRVLETEELKARVQALRETHDYLAAVRPVGE